MTLIEMPGVRAITEQLDKIREAAKVPPARFEPNIIDKEINEEEAGQLLHPSGFLADQNGRPFFLYIVDHTVIPNAQKRRKARDPEHPEMRNKLHFYVCSTLRDFKRKGRLTGRYRQTDRTDGLYRVELREGRNELPLHPCKNCLNESGYGGAVNRFNPKHALKISKNKIRRWIQQQNQNVRPATAPAGYPHNWKEVSRRYKQSQNWTCEKCSVKLSDRNLRGLSETHHINGDKSDCHLDNLHCLCKQCHAGEHPHMQLTTEESRLIEAQRRRQGID